MHFLIFINYLNFKSRKLKNKIENHTKCIVVNIIIDKINVSC